MRITILGAGFGGLELSTMLVEAFGGEHEIVLIDKTKGFVFGFSKLDVMFGRQLPSEVFHPYSDIDKPGLRFLQSSITAIDPEAKRVTTQSEVIYSDILVVALGADLDPSATPGLVECGHEFYSVAGAFSLREELSAFEGGDVIVGVTSTPFKCPPAPSETALLMHDYLTERGIRNTSSVSLVMPLSVPIPPSPAASAALLVAFAERGIAWYPERTVSRLDSARKVAVFSDDTEMSFDLFLGVPKHTVPQVVEDSGLAIDGWIPVDPLTLETRFENVYAVGDVTSVGTPKAGVFSEGQASVVAQRIISKLRHQSASSTYGGEGTCFLEFGDDQVARVNVTFLAGQAPSGTMDGPSREIANDKVEFGTSRVARWFGRA